MTTKLALPQAGLHLTYKLNCKRRAKRELDDADRHAPLQRLRRQGHMSFPGYPSISYHFPPFIAYRFRRKDLMGQQAERR
jgi:hypothetical protein